MDRKLPPQKLARIPAALNKLEVVEFDALDAVMQEAAMRMPIKDAMKELGARLSLELDDNLRKAIERRLGEPLTDPAILEGRLTVHPDGQDIPEAERGETYALDLVPILWVGPVKLEREGDASGYHMKGSRQLRHLIPRP